MRGRGSIKQSPRIWRIRGHHAEPVGTCADGDRCPVAGMRATEFVVILTDQASPSMRAPFMRMAARDHESAKREARKFSAASGAARIILAGHAIEDESGVLLHEIEEIIAK